jgi:translocation and assembly module TamA
VDIEAPDDLKSLLGKHLNLVRLGQMAHDDVDEAEWSRLIDSTPAQVRELLQTEGYFAPRVKLTRTAASPDTPDSVAGTVHVSVQPGPRARVGRVTIEAEGALRQDAAAGDAHASAALAALRQKWALPGGSEFRNAAWSDAKAAALANLRAQGYAAATWAGTGAEVDPDSHEVRIFVVVDSGPLFRWGRLNIEGLATQDAETVRNLVAARRGAPVTEPLLLDFQERLQKSGLFENVTVLLDPDPRQAAEATILARLGEAPLQTYVFGVGISPNTGPRASVEHRYRRVFGWAASARNKVEWGEKRQAWDGEIASHPNEGLYSNLIGGAVENLVSDTDTVLSQRVRLGRSQDRKTLERLFYVEVERSLRTATVSGERDQARAVSFNFNGSWRHLDNLVSPTQGVTLTGELGVGRSDGTNATAGYFMRAWGRLTGYLPLGGQWYSQARLELGHVALRPGMVVPESKRWRAGGDDSVRGYAYRSLGPIVDGAVDSGTSVMTTSVEVARPILASMPSLWGAVFLDAGQAANDFSELKPVLGMGAGVRWRSPVGPLSLDYAWGRETRKWMLHFGVGITF